MRSRASSAKARAIILSMCTVESIWTAFHRFGAMFTDIEKKSWMMPSKLSSIASPIPLFLG